MSRPYMTPAGATELLPTDVDRRHWQSVVSDQLNAQCAITGAIVIPEAPRTRAVAYVQVHADRYVSGSTGTRSTESVTLKRRVINDGHRWLVDVEFAAG